MECSVDNFFYDSSANEPWPVIKYSVTLNHSDYYCNVAALTLTLNVNPIP